MSHPSPDELDLVLSGARRLASSEMRWRASTSGGPGGQHANRTASRVSLSVDIEQLPLGPRERALVYERLASRITGAGSLVVHVSEHRDQRRNRVLAVRRMEQLILGAIAPVKGRIKTRPSRGAQSRVRLAKQHRSAQKRDRRRRWSADDDA